MYELELTNIEVADFASEETFCFAAILNVNGKPFAKVSNAGHGGPDRVDPIIGPYNGKEFQDRLTAIDIFLAESDEGKEYTARAVAEHGDDFADFTFDLESWCAERVVDYLMAIELTKALKETVMFAKSDGTIAQWRWPGVTEISEAHIDAVRKDCDGPILNEMPMDEALALYKTHGET